jgi:uncharacterized protein YycO
MSAPIVLGTAQTVRIGAYGGRGILSTLIKWRTWTPYSHVSLVLRDGSEIEAWWGGVMHRAAVGAIHRPGTRIELYEVDCTPEQCDDIESFALAQVGKPYDYGAIIGFVLRARTASSRKWFCSELVFAAFAAAGIRLLRGVAERKVAPGDIVRSPLLRLAEVVTTG